MLRFRLGRIPVDVHFTHVLFSALLGYSFAPGFGDSTGWPANVLQDSGSPDRALTLAICTAIWMAVISLSVLVHELGHALASLAFGYQPGIQLVALGGLTTPNAREPIPWHKDVLLTLAGPMFGFGLGVASLVAYFLTRESSEVAEYVLLGAAGVNLVWSVVNLFPVAPLDGGRISTAVLMRAFGKRGFLFAQVLGLLVGGAVAVLGALRGQPFLAIFFALYAFRAFSMISAYLRGEAPAAAPAHPTEVAFAQAGALFSEGKVDEALRLAEQSLEADPPPGVRGRLHHLLGWIALKRGHGRAALDHFAQVQGQAVEPHALAAAFSLIGDDSRALTLWELAYRQAGNPTVLHEWAGTLIRSGRTEEARKLPGVDLAAAYACAERVAFLREDFAEAARLGEEALSVAEKPETAYDAACAYARAGDASSALRLLERASQLGFTNAEYAETDADLQLLQRHPGFQAWLGRLRRVARA